MKKLLLSLLLLPFVNSSNCNIPELQEELDVEVDRNFGGWSMSQELFDHILKLVPAGSTVIELGSGWASSQLSKHYTVYSIEHDANWVGKYTTNYIYAPIENGWYNVAAVKKGLPKHYDLVLIDGPTGAIGRGGFLTNLSLFDTNAILIFDDVNRSAEAKLMKSVAKALNRKFTVYATSDKKKFGVILPK